MSAETGVTFDGLWRPLSAVVAGQFVVGRSWRKRDGSPVQDVFTIGGEAVLYDAADATAVAEALNQAVAELGLKPRGVRS